jgi:peptidoglycan/LPS O-acetylase OafA/YrhL
MTAITTPRIKGSSDSLLRFALRADATASGLMGLAGIPLAGWLAEISGTTKAFEYSMSAFFIAFAVGVFAFAARPSVKRTGIVVAAGNVLYTVASVVFVLADVLPLTTVGVVLTLAVGVYTLVMAELQYQGVRRIKG